MSMQEMLTSAREAITVRRVFGEPYERDGVTIIPVASVMGGGGGGSGRDAGGASGDGGGFGVRARPVGAFVIRDGGVRWEPALDLNRITWEARSSAWRPSSCSQASSGIGSAAARHPTAGGCQAATSLTLGQPLCSE